MTAAVLVLSLSAILLGAELFTNALEHLGSRMRLSQGVTGSVFAAIATAMPEAAVPIIALAGHHASPVREAVATGAILGAPLMLATLALFLTAVAAALQRGIKGALRPEWSGLKRDLSWFVVSFGLSALAALVPHDITWFRTVVAVLLVLLYALYLFVTLRASAGLVATGHGTVSKGALYLPMPRFVAPGVTLALQLALGGALVAVGTTGFIHAIERLAAHWPVLVLSLVVIPIATELPEKVNSILWIRKGDHDTLAFGNITGALVFQGTLLPAIGIWLTPWTARPDVLLSVALTLLAAIYLLVLGFRGRLRPYHLLFNGACYALYLVLVMR